MYVHVVSFTLKEGNDVTFLEMQKFEEDQDAKPAGLDHYHILKDRKNKNTYWLLEYWENKEMKDKFDDTDMHKYFHDLRDELLDTSSFYQCDVLV